MFEAISRVHGLSIANYQESWYKTIQPDEDYVCGIPALPEFTGNLYTEFNDHIYKSFR